MYKINEKCVIHFVFTESIEIKINMCQKIWSLRIQSDRYKFEVINLNHNNIKQKNVYSKDMTLLRYS